MKRKQNPVTVSDPESLEKLLPPKSGVNQFKVPDAYFDQLPARIHDRIAKDSNSAVFPNLSIKQFVRLRFIIPLAAAMLIIGIIVFFPHPKDPNTVIATKQDTSATMEEYDESYAAEAQFEEYSYAVQALQDSDHTGEVVSAFISQNKESISEQDIAEYLNDQDLDADVLAEL